ncbi:MAG: hypothetical protein KDE45_11880, partial [Caldilineaceae bacterium]|nr:hypothetical protein [Caldilineaceae bacterium]
MLAISLQDDSERSTGYRYALTNMLPFAVVSNLSGTAADDPAYDLAEFSQQHLADRAFMLSTLLGMNLHNKVHGSLSTPIKFTHLAPDSTGDLVFDGDFKGYGSLDSASPEDYDSQRARYVFGSANADNSSTIIASNNADHLYGMGGADTIEGLDGSDHIEGGVGDDKLFGGEKSDGLFGGKGNDELRGGTGSDYLIGGTGKDKFIWNAGDGDDVIGDYDDGGDRILVDGTDLADLPFTRTSVDSPYYTSASRPDISLHYEGDFLTVNAGSGADAGSVTLTQYTPLAGADYGIVLRDAQEIDRPADVTVTRLDITDAGTDPIAFWRQQSSQGGYDWSATALRFEAQSVVNYQGGSLHGTDGGAFEGGPLADHLSGDSDNNALHGLAGDDLIEGLAGDDFLEGWSGSDRLVGGAGGDILLGGVRAGLADRFDADGGPRDQFYLAQLAGAPDDVDILDGGEGNDYASGGAYTDYLTGGSGTDYLLGGAGADYISGGAQRDIIYGDSALDYGYVEQAGGTFGEQLYIAFAGGAHSAGRYDDVIHAGAGDDTVWGELGDDAIHGGAGGDNLIGDRFNDPNYFAAELPAYADTSPALDAALHGDDRLYGGEGSDLLLGLGGDDLLAGGTDNDSLVGGPGDDIYVLQAGDGWDAIQDSQGRHTLLFTGIALDDLKVFFRGEKVTVGTVDDVEGLYLSRSEWPNVRIALDTPDALIERSRLDHLYFDAGGTLLFTVKGTQAMTESERDSLFSVDSANANAPRVVVGAGADAVEVEKYVSSSGGQVRIVRGGLQLLLELSGNQVNRGWDFLDLFDGVSLSVYGFAGDIVGTDGPDHIIGSGSGDVIRGDNSDDTLEGRGGDDELDGGWGRDTLLGDAGDDELDGGPGDDTLRGGPGNDTLRGGRMGDRDYLEGGPGD